MSQGILSTIGHTPLIKRERLLGSSRLNLYAKLEFFILGGSIKDRPAYRMVTEAFKFETLRFLLRVFPTVKTMHLYDLSLERAE